MAELRRLTKGELQLNVIAIMYGVPYREVEKLYFEIEKGTNHENDLPAGRKTEICFTGIDKKKNK